VPENENKQLFIIRAASFKVKAGEGVRILFWFPFDKGNAVSPSKKVGVNDPETEEGRNN
jgi:hypothetical protein